MRLSHVDRPPLGDLANLVVTAATDLDVEFTISLEGDGREPSRGSIAEAAELLRVVWSGSHDGGGHFGGTESRRFPSPGRRPSSPATRRQKHDSGGRESRRKVHVLRRGLGRGASRTAR